MFRIAFLVQQQVTPRMIRQQSRRGRRTSLFVPQNLTTRLVLVLPSQLNRWSVRATRMIRQGNVKFAHVQMGKTNGMFGRGCGTVDAAGAVTEIGRDSFQRRFARQGLPSRTRAHTGTSHALLPGGLWRCSSCRMLASRFGYSSRRGGRCCCCGISSSTQNSVQCRDTGGSCSNLLLFWTPRLVCTRRFSRERFAGSQRGSAADRKDDRVGR